MVASTPLLTLLGGFEHLAWSLVASDRRWIANS